MDRLLIVDDEPDVVEGLYKLFWDREGREMDVFRACSAPQALAMMERERIDVLLSDIHMPGMTGLELLRQVRARWPRCRVIFLTGYTDFDSIYRATQDGAVGYLLKTEERDRIVAAVDEALEDIRGAQRALELCGRLERAEALARYYQNQQLLTALAAGEGSPASLLTRLDPAFDPKEPLWVAAARPGVSPGTAQPGMTSLVRALEELLGDCLDAPRRAAAAVEEGLALVLLQGGFGAAQLRGAAEAAQSALLADWGAEVSVALSAGAVPPVAAGRCYARLAARLRQSLPFGALLLMDGADGEPGADSEARAVTLVKQYVAAHLEQELSLSRLAGQVYLNPSYLSRLFHRETGMTLTGYINVARVERAKQLLRGSNMRILDIAAQVGLESASYFNQVFRKYTGLSPQQYRKQEVK